VLLIQIRSLSFRPFVSLQQLILICGSKKKIEFEIEIEIELNNCLWLNYLLYITDLLI